MAVHQLVELTEDFGLPVRRIAGFQFFDLFALGRLKEFPEHRGVECVDGVKVGRVADAVRACRGGACVALFGAGTRQMAFNGLLKRDLFCVADHDGPLK
ncbi:hypothetical protein [Yoonia maricola]|uniref:hypothetical protein n=1 Tax=Yoonia maricola TaxID=420999 RepID=UPI001FE53C0E|nr:hypothetical protein [Yoonia maricola]